MQQAKFLINQIVWSSRYEGWLATFLKIFMKGFKSLRIPIPYEHILKKWIDHQFDSRFNVDTFGIVEVENLDISKDQKREAVEYAPTPATFGIILSSMQLDFSEYVFVDMGSGKGKVLFMASSFPFSEIIGVEISETLCQSAGKNINRFKSSFQNCFNLNVICSDAKSFTIPEDRLVLYFYNPFSEKIMKDVLNSICLSLNKKPRSIFIIYYNPQHKSVIESTGKFIPFEIDGWNDPMWNIYHSV